MATGLFIILLAILASAFFSISEISLAASRDLKLKQLKDEGNKNAGKILDLQANPGNFFTVVQIGLNAVSILAGIIGESIFSPYISQMLEPLMPVERAAQLGAISSFVMITSIFVLFADLMPKRIAMLLPERIALRIVRPMQFLMTILRPLAWFFNGLSNLLFKLFRIPTVADDKVTSDDVYAMVEAGVLAGVIRKHEHELIENLFDLDVRTVTSLMTLREQVICLSIYDSQEVIRQKVTEFPHSKFLVCRHSIDEVIGYVDSKDMLSTVLTNKDLNIQDKQNLQQVLLMPDTLNLSSALESFKRAREDFAAVINEYGLLVGVVTLNDVLSALMGDLVSMNVEEQIVQRDENSWLMEGSTPIDDVKRALGVEAFPREENYETVGGFIMYTLKRLPKRTDAINHAGYKFEVMDVDANRVEQVLVSKIQPTPPQAKAQAHTSK